MITDKQEKILKIIIDYIQTERISPTVREICDLSGLKSTATIHSHLARLEEQGYISKRNKSPKSLIVLKTI